MIIAEGMLGLGQGVLTKGSYITSGRVTKLSMKGCFSSFRFKRLESTQLE